MGIGATCASSVRAGAEGYLIKDDDAAKLADTIRSVHAGHLALTAELMSIINDDPPELSPQEARALYLYGTGSTLAATARRMGVTIPTVRSYLALDPRQMGRHRRTRRRLPHSDPQVPAPAGALEQ